MGRPIGLFILPPTYCIGLSLCVCQALYGIHHMSGSKPEMLKQFPRRGGCAEGADADADADVYICICICTRLMDDFSKFRRKYGLIDVLSHIPQAFFL
jgi:hypothetical protein